MKVITYQVNLLEPVLVGSLEGDPNSSVALGYLPGSALRGAVIGRYMRQHGLKALDAADPYTRRLFFDGATRYLNGYLLYNNWRTLCAPLSWHHPKGDKVDVRDLALGEWPEDDERQPEVFSAPFTRLTDSTAYKLDPRRQISVHTQRTRRYGRAMPEDKIKEEDNPGAVYRYDALAAGQSFEAAVLCDHDNDNDILKPLLSGEASLGGSGTAGYGRVAFEGAQLAQTWREAGSPDDKLEGVDGKLVVTLLSHALLRDENGQYTVDPAVVTRALKARLGVPLGEAKPAFVRGILTGGFNRTWGLPLPQVLALHMGSVFVYQKPHCPVEKLRDLEALGIGERRAEGFGRVAVNWQTEHSLQAADSSPEVPAPITISGRDARKLAQDMAGRMLRRRLDERLLARANEVKVDPAPSRAQISRLRGVILDELMKPSPNLGRIDQYLTDVEKRSSSRKQYERARVDNQSFLEWLRATLKDPGSKVRSMLYGEPPSVGGVHAELTDELQKRYVLLYTDAVLARAAKKEG